MMDNGVDISGHCYCGAVHFCAQGPIHFSANCHCENCRRAFGAQAVAWISVDRAHFSFTRGEPRIYRTDTRAERSFCPKCGTSLTYASDRRPGHIDIATANLDHPEDYPPSVDAYPKEHLPWVPLLPGRSGSQLL